MNTSKYAEEYQTLEQDLMSGSLSAQELMEKSKRHAFLKPIVEKENEIASVLKAIEDDRAMIKDGSDKEMAALAAAHALYLFSCVWPCSLRSGISFR